MPVFDISVTSEYSQWNWPKLNVSMAKYQNRQSPKMSISKNWVLKLNKTGTKVSLFIYIDLVN